MKYTAKDIGSIISASSPGDDRGITHLLLDSRKVQVPASSVFFAIKGERRNGHLFIAELYKKQVRCFVVSETMEEGLYPEAVFLKVNDTLVALQQLSAYHRQQFSIPVIGITGSNGKTIVKEWGWQLLNNQFSIIRSPASYNSQIGVPLSVWQITDQHNLAIIEAGISRQGEMEKLEKIIQPTIGILTNIGEPHSEGFDSRRQKLEEKLLLFQNCSVIMGREQDLFPVLREEALLNKQTTVLTWGYSSANILFIQKIAKQETDTSITYRFSGEENEVSIPFTDDVSIENALTACLLCHHLAKDTKDWQEKLTTLEPVSMRMEVKKGINQCVLINDSYSADLTSLDMALAFLDNQPVHLGKTAILSDFLQTGEPDELLYRTILDKLSNKQFTRLIGIGKHITAALQKDTITKQSVIPAMELYESTDDFIQHFLSSRFKEEVLLIKGARSFGFERIVQLLELKLHQTILEINLNAIVNNVKTYQQQLRTATKVMAMVKAFAYGSGGAEVANVLQYHKVDYLAVAYADEGVELRKAGIGLPIMVMNVEETAFESIINYNLEPDIYSFALLRNFESFLAKNGLSAYPAHIEIETGMNRLGFAMEEIEALAIHLAMASLLQIKSVFSHLACSDDPGQDAFTFTQLALYKEATQVLKRALPYSFIQHIANSAAIFRLPELQLDMVRLGIGMYGVDSANTHQHLLQPVATLKSTIAQLKQVKAGESVSYGRKGVVTRDSVIATIRIGYADGFSRRLGHGTAYMLVKGKKATVVGTVCMDMTMIDVTDIEGVKENDEVIIFGKELPIQQLAAWSSTIPYEIMTGISQRVKRVYFET